MNWSFRIAKIAGIDVKIHLTFFLLLVWIGWAHYRETQDTRAAIGGVVFVLLVFASVVLHEFGHALVARRYGIRTRDITLLPIGGVARLERMPEDPKAELAVAVAGPAVNVVIAGTLWAGLAAFGGLPLPSNPELPAGGLLTQLAGVNIALAVFNLLPAFPMDGGRVVRALLAMRLGHVRATQIASTIGQGLALVFGFLGLLFNPVLIFVALFVWLGAAAEGSAATIRAALSGWTVESAMVRDVRVVTSDAPLEAAIVQLLDGHQHDFPVVSGPRVVGMLTRKRLLEALARQGPDVRVGEVMDGEFVVAHPRDRLTPAHQKLTESSCPSAPVVATDGSLVGVLTQENISELLLVQAALEDHRKRQAG